MVTRRENQNKLVRFNRITFRNFADSVQKRRLVNGARELATVVIPVVASFAVYFLTLTREFAEGDSAELALQAAQFGVAHPPSYPIHTLLGYTLTRIFDEPAYATNILSAVSTSLAVGILALICKRITQLSLYMILPTTFFAFLSRTWDMAVITEIYNVNLLFLSLSICLFLHWYRDGVGTYLLISSVVFGISFGTSLVNVLLIPAFLYLIWQTRENWLECWLKFLAGAVVCGLAVMSISIIRSQVVVPLGSEYLLDSVGNTINFFSGKQYGSVGVQSLDFYFSRVFEHANIFSANLLVVGIPIGFFGFAALWKRERALAIFTLIIFVINFAYFTCYINPDYPMMITPSYFIFAIWIACSFQFDYFPLRRIRLATSIVLALLCLSTFYAQFERRVERAAQIGLTEFTVYSLNIFPENALVVTSWPRYTMLNYYQTLHGVRDDILLIERVEQPRQYKHGYIGDYRDYVRLAILERPVVIDTNDEELADLNIQVFDLSWFVAVRQAE